MTYNPIHERTDRSQRRTKRTRPEKKNSPMVKRGWPTKPKDQKKRAKLKAHRGRHINDAIDYAADVEEPEPERQVPRIVTCYIQANGTILPKNGRYPYITESPWMEDFNPADGTFSGYTTIEEWSYYLG